MDGVIIIVGAVVHIEVADPVLMPDLDVDTHCLGTGGNLYVTNELGALAGSCK